MAAASRSSSQILRSLAKELKLIYGKTNMNEVPAYAYLRDQTQEFEVTGEKICREQQEISHVASTYLCYLESLRLKEDVHSLYKGKGERSVESSAAIVGLKLPHLYQDDSGNKTPDP